MAQQSMVESFDFQWSSTAAERYDTDMIKKVHGAINEAGYETVTEWGGTALDNDDPDALVSDNGVQIDCMLEEAADLAARITKVTGHSVRVTPTLD